MRTHYERHAMQQALALNQYLIDKLAAGERVLVVGGWSADGSAPLADAATRCVDLS